MTRFQLRSLVPAAFAGMMRCRAGARADDRIRAGDAAQPAGRPGAPAHRQVEQLQYRNSQLEQQLARAQPAAAAAAAPRARAPPPQPQYAPPPRVSAAAESTAAASLSAAAEPIRQQDAYPPAPPPAGGRRGDAFDPNQNPNAPGVPRTLGGPGTVAAAPPLDDEERRAAVIGAPGGRQAGAPLDLGIMAEEAANAPPPRREVRQIPGALPPPPPRNPSGTGAQQMVMAPTNTPKDEYDLAYGYVLRKDYALAEDGVRAFIKKYPNDRLVADANYWLGETLFQRQRYREAAESFLDVSTKYEKSAKAPDSLLRLGQSLAALKEKEAACATLRRDPAQISARAREREAVGRARAEARSAASRLVPARLPVP